MDESQCRTCLGEANDIRFTVFKKVNGITIEEMLNKVATLKITQNDNFSKILCKKCFNEIVNAFTFRTKCLDTDRTLRGLEKKLLEMQYVRAHHEQAEEQEVYYTEEMTQEEALILDEDNDNDMKVDMDIDEMEELHEIVDEDEIEEGYIAYEIEEIPQPDYLDDYEQIEYLEGDQSISNIESKLELEPTKSCMFCKPNKLFKTDYGLDRHMFMEHNFGSNPNVCETCNIEYPIKNRDREEAIFKNIIKHANYHLEGKFSSCLKCYEVFKTEKQLENHVKLNHSKGNPLNKCKACGSTFSTFALLNEHLALRSDCRDMQEKSFKCYICNKVFNMGIAKKKHIKEEHHEKAGADCPLCLRCKIPSAIAFENHYKTHFVAPRFCCSYCGREFHESDRLQTHIKRTHDETVLECFWCGKTFRDKSGIARHILGVHFNSRDFKCSICSKAFTARYNLKEHMFAVHKTASKIYKCELCLQDFLYRRQFERHRDVCTGATNKRRTTAHSSSSY